MSSLEEEVRASFDKWTKEWNRGNVDGYLDGYWDSASTRYVAASSEGRTGSHTVTRGIQAIRQKYRDSAQKSVDKYGTMGHVSLTHFELQPFSCSSSSRQEPCDCGHHRDAVVFGEFLVVFPSPPTDSDSDNATHSTGCFTIHLHKFPNDIGWKIISEHTSP